MADVKVTALTATTAATADDLLYLVDDPGGTPVSKKITFADLQKDLVGNLNAAGFNITAIARSFAADGSGANPSYSFTGATGAGMWVNGANLNLTATALGIKITPAVGVKIQKVLSGNPTDLFHVAATGDANALVVADATGNVGIGTDTPGAALDIVDAVFPTIRMATATGDATNKSSVIANRHYLTAQPDFAIFTGLAQNSVSTAYFGGGVSGMNACTFLRFWVTPTYTTPIGTEYLRITSSGMRLQKGIGGNAADLFHVAATGDANAMVVADATGQVGLGVVPTKRLDIVGSSTPTILLSTSTTDATSKNASIAQRHYTNAEEPMALLFGASTSGASIAYIGGGSASLNAVQRVQFYASATTTTTTGTEIARITSGGKRIEPGGVTANVDASACLDLVSTTKGFLPPRMTTTERNAISTPATGLVIYNTTTNVLDFYNGSVWGPV